MIPEPDVWVGDAELAPNLHAMRVLDAKRKEEEEAEAYADEMAALGLVEWTADEAGNDFEGMEAECQLAWELARERCAARGVTCEPPLVFMD